MVAVVGGDGAGALAGATLGNEPSWVPAIVDCVEGVVDEVAVVGALAGVDAGAELALDVDFADEPQPTATSAVTRSARSIVVARPHRGDGVGGRPSSVRAGVRAGTETIAIQSTGKQS